MFSVNGCLMHLIIIWLSGNKALTHCRSSFFFCTFVCVECPRIWINFNFFSVLDHRKLCVHLEEPLVPTGSRNFSGTADGHRRAGRPSVQRLEREGRREFRLLGEEKEEKEGAGSGGDHVGRRREAISSGFCGMCSSCSQCTERF